MARGRNGSSMGYRFLGWIRRHPIISGIFGAFWLLIILLAVFAPKEDASKVAAASPSPTVAASSSPAVSPSQTLSPSPSPAATTAPAAPSRVASTSPAAAVAPATHRAVVDAPQPVQAPPPATQAPQPVTQAPSSVYYANCTEARAAGAAPIQQGQPGYRPALDRDHDGVACETN